MSAVWNCQPGVLGGEWTIRISSTDAIVVTRVDEVDAKHIVACVNACHGLSPEAIPEAVKALEHLFEIMQVSASRVDTKSIRHEALERALRAIRAVRE